MTVPIEDAYAAFAAEAAARLVSADFIAASDDLVVDPSSALEVRGDAPLKTVAGIVRLKTTSPRQAMGAPAQRRYVVERYLQVEMLVEGPDQATRQAALNSARAALALIPVEVPTLGGACERVIFGSPLHDGDAPDSPDASGDADTLGFTLRVRAGDPLGMTPAP